VECGDEAALECGDEARGMTGVLSIVDVAPNHRFGIPASVHFSWRTSPLKHPPGCFKVAENIQGIEY
jgi:hypothetical protein